MITGTGSVRSPGDMMRVDSSASVVLPPIAFQLERLDNQQSLLEEGVAELFNRLEQVLGPDTPAEQTEAAPTAGGPGHGYSNLANRLSNSVYRMEGLNDRLSAILNRLEV